MVYICQHGYQIQWWCCDFFEEMAPTLSSKMFGKVEWNINFIPMGF